MNQKNSFKAIAAGVAFFLAYGLQAQTPLCFAPAANYSTAATAFCVHSGDFNEDGHPDLAVANFLGNNISILIGSASGTFAPPVHYTVLPLPFAVTSADVNNDTHLDLVVASSANNGLSILTGNGTGAFTTLATPPTTTTNPIFVVATDLNGDGNVDLAVACPPLNYVAVFIGNGAAGFASGVTYTCGTAPRHIVAKDFNNDTKPDLAVVNDQSNDVAILINSGTGTFGPATSYQTGMNPYAVDAGDFNNDGKLDLAVAHFSQNHISVLIGNGNGTFAAPVNFAAGSQMQSIVSRDFNGDGKVDLATANYGTNNASIYLGNGNGTFASARNYATAAGPLHLTAADFDSNGKIDLAVACSNYNGATVLLSKPLPLISVSSGSVCRGNSYTLTPTGANTYTFSGGNSVVSPVTTTNYTIAGTSANGCTNTAVATVSVNASPTIAANGGTICSGESFTITPSGANSYSYSGGSNVVSPASTSSYSVTGTSSLGCSGSNTMVVTVSVKASPSTSLVSSNPELCSGESATLTASGANIYMWSTGASNTSSVVITPAVSTSYTVGGTSNGCVAIAVITQTVSECTGITEKHLQGFKMYPNPVSGALQLTFESGTGNIHLELYNVVGELVYLQKEVASTNVIEMGDFHSGLYTLKVLRGNETLLTKKLVKH